MAEPLPLADRIAQTSQFAQTENYIMLQYGDGYGQAARDGINSARTTWTISWDGLTKEEATTLRSTFRSLSRANPLIWQSPLSESEEFWMVTEHSGQPTSGGGIRWSYSASLTLLYGSFAV